MGGVEEGEGRELYVDVDGNSYGGGAVDGEGVAKVGVFVGGLSMEVLGCFAHERLRMNCPHIKFDPMYLV